MEPKSKPVAWGREEQPAPITYSADKLCGNFQNLNMGSSSNFSFGAQSSSSTQSSWYARGQNSTSSTHSYQCETSTPSWWGAHRTRRESAPAMLTYNPSNPINIPRTASPTYSSPWNNSVMSPPSNNNWSTSRKRSDQDDESHFSRTLMAMGKNSKVESQDSKYSKYSMKGPDTPFSMD